MALTTVRPQGMGFNTGRRNMVINGAMQVAQRGTSKSISVSGTHTLDRWNLDLQSAGTHTMSQSTDAPSGFTKSLKLEVTTADASLAAGDRLAIQYFNEAQNLQHLEYGAATAKAVTISFWVKSNVTGTYSAELIQQDNNNRHHPFTYSISSADTWEQKTVTIPGDASGVINDDTGSGLLIKWYLDAGSNFTSGTYTPNVWQTRTLANVVKSDSVNFCGTVGNEWYMTGVQFEVGENVSDFEHRSYAEELQLCRRYFTRYTGNTVFAVGQAISTSQASASVPLQQSMRVSPTLSHQGIKMRNSTGNSASASALSISNKTQDFIELLGTRDGSGLTAGNACQFRVNTTSDFLDFDAEI
jgi:hypothetical protein